MESAAADTAAASNRCWTASLAACEAMSYWATPFIAPPRISSRFIAATIAAPVESGAIESMVPIRPSPSVVPGTGSNENASNEPLWAVKSVGRARIRIVIVVAVRADRRCAHVARTHAYADHDFRLRICHRQQH
jgi:hypothetical protein